MTTLVVLAPPTIFGSIRSVMMFLSADRLKARKSCSVSGTLDSVPLGKGIVLPAPKVLAFMEMTRFVCRPSMETLSFE